MTGFSSLEDRVVLITGGAGHIGGAAAEAFAEVGARVAVADLDAGNAVNPRHLELSVDLGDLKAPEKAVSAVVDHFGRLDVVVAAAAMVPHADDEGAGWNVPFAMQDPDLWAEALTVNLTSIFALVQAAAEPLAAYGTGSVVLIGSQYGRVGPQPSLYEGTGLNNVAGYAVSKAGVAQLARWLATTMAPKVRVNSVTPGGIIRGQPKEFIERYEELTPLGRMGKEQDLTGPVLFLASDQSSYVTGHDLVVDGGFTSW